MISKLFFIGMASLLLAGCGPATNKVNTRKLKLSASAEGASAYVAGKKFSLPHEFKMKPGTYLFRIEKPGFAAEWFSCRVRADGVYASENDTSGALVWKKLLPPEKKVTLKKQGGSVLIIGKPEAAEVVEKDQVLGTVPLVLTGQRIGRHEAQMRSPNYAERRIVWEIRDARPVTVRSELKSNVGEIILGSTPENARIFIDGKLCGKTPYRGPLTAGSHMVRLELDGCMPFEKKISVPLGQTHKETFRLAASPGGLSIRSTPDGAQVTVNGEVKGSTPLMLNDIPAGDYQVAVTFAGFDREEQTVKVVPGSIANADFTLNSSIGGMDLDIFPAGVSVYVNSKPYGQVKQKVGSLLQTELVKVRNLSPGSYTVKVMHKRAATERREIVVEKGRIARPPRIELWVPNAEITFAFDGHTETGMIYSETETEIRFGSCKGIITTINRTQIKSIKMLDINE